MKIILDICKKILDKEISSEDLKSVSTNYNIYPHSITKVEGSILFLAKLDNVKFLVILEQSPLFTKFEGELILDNRGKICPLNYNNSQYLRETFPFTSPTSHKGHPITIGLGDRLGLASIGHLRLAKEYKFFPILAQQSIRELNLTGRTYVDVLDAASWSVFQEGYKNGFGADGDHLKTHEEVKMALDCGFTMITLDCSDYIDNSIYEMDEEQIEQKYSLIEKPVRQVLEKKYLNKAFVINNNMSLTFNNLDFKRIVLVYLNTIEHAASIYKELLTPLHDRIDFELSIDETLFTTSIEAHYFVAAELIDRGVKISSLAPRFCGEFQKGIDYIGDQKQFEEEFTQHFLISGHFGYKISVHSGSDKFSVFPIIGKVTNGNYHLKTAGTNWLEAVRVIALKDPSLFRDIYDFGAKHLEEAKKYYYIKAQSGDIISLDHILDTNIPALLDDENVRQILHITYGLILQNKSEDNKYIFRDRIFELLNTYEEDYSKKLYEHIGKHVEKLNIEKLADLK